MDPHLQSSRVDPRKQALLEGRLSGRGKVRKSSFLGCFRDFFFVNTKVSILKSIFGLQVQSLGSVKYAKVHFALS